MAGHPPPVIAYLDGSTEIFLRTRSAHGISTTTPKPLPRRALTSSASSPCPPD
ncbi:hypothetical protein N8I86_01795 [Streptomyces albidocamelliae]|uniref:Uncharacterized protein n=1 Tax=Streptomyces albidocamelliae TaxID=2981135 RepID=A0ABY6F0N7_9ACTN|nr:hypothetical protein N8I86_01795 [Streptomyces sp. HUAS 14-6]